MVLTKPSQAKQQSSRPHTPAHSHFSSSQSIATWTASAHSSPRATQLTATQRQNKPTGILSIFEYYLPARAFMQHPAAALAIWAISFYITHSIDAADITHTASHHTCDSKLDRWQFVNKLLSNSNLQRTFIKAQGILTQLTTDSLGNFHSNRLTVTTSWLL